jgi:hypothetical protein
MVPVNKRIIAKSFIDAKFWPSDRQFRSFMCSTQRPVTTNSGSSPVEFHCDLPLLALLPPSDLPSVAFERRRSLLLLLGSTRASSVAYYRKMWMLSAHAPHFHLSTDAIISGAEVRAAGGRTDYL